MGARSGLARPRADLAGHAEQMGRGGWQVRDDCVCCALRVHVCGRRRGSNPTRRIVAAHAVYSTENWEFKQTIPNGMGQNVNATMRSFELATTATFVKVPDASLVRYTPPAPGMPKLDKDIFYPIT